MLHTLRCFIVSYIATPGQEIVAFKQLIELLVDQGRAIESVTQSAFYVLQKNDAPFKLWDVVMLIADEHNTKESVFSLRNP